MSLLNEYVQKEQQLKQLRQELDRLENDERLKKELEFKEKLEALMQEFNKTTGDVLALLEPGKGSQKAAATPTGRRKRRLKIYKNPHTGNVIETRGGNHKELRAWKEEYGNDTVESWLVRMED